MRHRLMTAFGIVLVAVLARGVVPAAAQAPATPADIQRLKDSVYEADRDISAVRDRDGRLADSLQAQLDDLRDEVIYLKVKLRTDALILFGRP